MSARRARKNEQNETEQKQNKTLHEDTREREREREIVSDIDKYLNDNNLMYFELANVKSVDCADVCVLHPPIKCPIKIKP